MRLASFRRTPPAVEHLRGGASDGSDEMSVLAALKGGLNLPAPLPPAIAVPRGEAVAEQGTHTGRGRALGIGAGVLLKHVLDMLGMTQEIGVVAAKAHRDDVAISARAVEEEAQWVALSKGDDAQERVAPRARRR